jgi:hypothetical protein
MKGYRHREAKGYQYSSRQMALSYISNVVAYRNGSIIGTMRRRSPIPVKVIFLHEAPNLVIINVFSLQKTLETIAKQALVILIDEFRTFIICSTCHSELANSYREQGFLCNHK